MDEDVKRMSIHLILHTAKLLEQFQRKAFAPYGILPAQGRVLSVLLVNGAVHQNRIAKGLHLSPPTVTVMLRTMEKKGLIRRYPSRENESAISVELTQSGILAAMEVHRAWDEMENKISRILSEDGADDLKNLLHKLRDGFGGKDPGIKHKGIEF
ncbi:MarR family transcriptional regulator [Lentisphaerota bacterium ZTH]|nr:MarR family transcriptional regulator [Lentisphaerota bacterium]WET05845.1 MarR family transcriptional regulator [Lentisphaerota bacterium ZTH]